ncbi:MAG: MFS transporter [Oscillospiraceae bacterium]|nr:MFS transporter [Oscillospiraceae bacterium]
MNLKIQLRRLNAFGFAACLRIPDAIWVVLLAARGFSLWQIGLAEGIFHIVSLICEIPSGMAADLMGRRRSMAAAGICGLVSALLMAFAEGFAGVCVSMAFSALACTFVSGSDEALLYDSLLQAGREQEHLRVNARYARVQNLGSMLSNAASLLAGVLSYVRIYLVDGAVCLARTLLALSLTEPTVTENQAQRQAHPFRDLGKRFCEHVSQVAAFLRGSPRAAVLMLADGLLCLPSYLTLMFLQQRLSEQGFQAMWLGLPVMCISFSRMVGTALGERLQPRGIRGLYIVCALIVGSGTIIAGAAAVVPAVLGAMAAAGAMDAWMLHLQKYLNKLFPSDRRATLVSVNMMAYSLLMIAASPLVGWLGDVYGSAGVGLCALGAVVALSGAAGLLRGRR